MKFRKRKKALGTRRRKFNGLKLTLEDNRGKATTYFVPYRRPMVTMKKPHSILQANRRNKSLFWQIEDKSIDINSPETLINAEIVLRKGNVRVVGRVRRVSPLYKSPEGEPVPVPPPPRARIKK